MLVSIFHNPRCSKSRAAMAALEEHGIDAETVLYLDAPPTAVELAEVIGKLGIEAKALIRFGESRAKELGISVADERSAMAWITLMVENPILIERPIVITADKAAIGRPLERVLDLFDL
ncbi:Uncharacterized protein YfgD, not an arsenate reductase [hydrothermal vent metagenome]|uniref:Uncharacterized protein YfgD, not an arsenate reductase n=1 Tax=hydrothermal vent metagenome TaxID=652676 RepID=A0A3B1BB68_9ZZZZ